MSDPFGTLQFAIEEKVPVLEWRYTALEEEKFNRKNRGNYSEGLASISAVLKQGGHDVKLYHQLYMPDKAEFIENVKKFAKSKIKLLGAENRV